MHGYELDKMMEPHSLKLIFIKKSSKNYMNIVNVYL